MAGKELYIEPILDANLSVVPGLSENIAEMTAQLNETTRILMNMMGNQGLELHQQAYNGSAFSALTLTGLNFPSDAADTAEAASIRFTTDLAYNKFVTSEWVYQEFSGKAHIDGGIQFYPWIDLKNTRKVKIPYASHNGLSLTSVELTIYFVGGGSETINGSVGDSFTFEGVGGTIETGYYAVFDLPNVEKQVASAAIKTTWNSTSNAGYYLLAPILVNAEDMEETQIIYYYPKIRFNSANALAFKTLPGVQNKIWTTSVKITLPDIATVGSWTTFLLNGNIEGASVAIIDNTTNEILLALPAATSDITQLTQTNDLALKVTFGSLTNVINSIAQRYY